MTRSRWHLAARLLLFFLLAVNVYRAATQSITTDEAFTFNRSVVTPIPALWHVFDANDHVLHTLLCKVSVGLFGSSELTLRIPALLGGALYLWIAYRFSVMIAIDGPALLIAVAMFALNPVMLDYCSIARGYGMATALLLLSLYHLIQLSEKPVELWRLNVTGCCLALAVAANLTVALPGVALIAAFTVSYLSAPIRDRYWARVQDRVDYLLDRMIVPGIVVAVSFLLIPLLPAKRENFYVGASSLHDTALSLAYACFWRPRNYLEHTIFHTPVEDAAVWLGLLIVPVLVVAHLWWRPRLTDLAMATVVGTLALQTLLNTLYNVPYPERRTGLYYVPLVTLVLLGVLKRIPRGYLLCIPIAVQFLCQWNVRFYDEWLFDAGNRDTMLYLGAHRPPGEAAVRMSASWPMLHSVGYYRRRLDMDWLEIPEPNERLKEGYDVYLLAEYDSQLVEKYHLKVVYQHPLSRALLATR